MEELRRELSEVKAANYLYITDGAIHFAKAFHNPPKSYAYKKERDANGQRIPLKDAKGENYQVDMPCVEISHLNLMHYGGSVCVPLGGPARQFRELDIHKKDGVWVEDSGYDVSKVPGLIEALDEADRLYWEDYANRE